MTKLAWNSCRCEHVIYSWGDFLSPYPSFPVCFLFLESLYMYICAHCSLCEFASFDSSSQVCSPASVWTHIKDFAWQPLRCLESCVWLILSGFTWSFVYFIIFNLIKSSVQVKSTLPGYSGLKRNGNVIKTWMAKWLFLLYRRLGIHLSKKMYSRNYSSGLYDQDFGCVQSSKCLQSWFCCLVVRNKPRHPERRSMTSSMLRIFCPEGKLWHMIVRGVWNCWTGKNKAFNQTVWQQHCWCLWDLWFCQDFQMLEFIVHGLQCGEGIRDL